MSKKLTVKKLATIDGSDHVLYLIGTEVYRVTDENLDVFGVPMSKRWESSYEAFLSFFKRGAFPYVQMIS